MSHQNIWFQLKSEAYSPTQQNKTQSVHRDYNNIVRTKNTTHVKILFSVISANDVMGATQRFWSMAVSFCKLATKLWSLQKPVNSVVSFAKKYPQHENYYEIKSEVA